ncbi:hypothetical protein KVF89_11775 [Nocardioides carbamazepini]|uniref:hypothetical protein n=1 Tax=Nocardioides carbamazepini TaxID=2854259 RepID=UPI00214A800B|nr:hypothetical protein [Nocardioides carbamazepini]MCR1783214.1 hypothetical protein [Nocardioides carbamazepini]
MTSGASTAFATVVLNRSYSKISGRISAEVEMLAHFRYRQVDLAQAAAFDALLPDEHAHSEPRGMGQGSATAGIDLTEF